MDQLSNLTRQSMVGMGCSIIRHPNAVLSRVTSGYLVYTIIGNGFLPFVLEQTFTGRSNSCVAWLDIICELLVSSSRRTDETRSRTYQQRIVIYVSKNSVVDMRQADRSERSASNCHVTDRAFVEAAVRAFLSAMPTHWSRKKTWP